MGFGKKCMEEIVLNYNSVKEFLGEAEVTSRVLGCMFSCRKQKLKVDSVSNKQNLYFPFT